MCVCECGVCVHANACVLVYLSVRTHAHFLKCVPATTARTRYFGGKN